MGDDSPHGEDLPTDLCGGAISKGGSANVFPFELSTNLGIPLTIVKFSFIEAYEYSSREPIL
jgi:hypothetical protein